MTIGSTKTFNHKPYRCVAVYDTKKDADIAAGGVRRKGLLARMSKEKYGKNTSYYLYVR